MQELFYALAGCIFGIFTGIAPGIHVNTVAAFAVLFAQKGDMNSVLFIVCMSVVHTFVDFLPSIILGAPDAENFLSVLPGHRLLLKGYGHYAVQLSVFGGVFGAMFSLLLVPFYIGFVSQYIEMLYAGVPVMLALVLALMVLSEKRKKWAIAVIMLSSLLGIFVLRGNIASGNQLLAVISGLFGASTLLYSLRNKPLLCRQKICESRYNKKEVVEGSLLSAIAGGFVSLLPSLGPNQAAFVLSKVMGKIKTTKYLVILGGISTSNMIFSFFALYLLGKGRTGSAVAIGQIAVLSPESIVLIAAAIVFAVGFGAVATEVIGKWLLRRMHKVNYRKLSIVVIAVLVCIVGFLSGAAGLAVFAVSTAIGIIPQVVHIKRTSTMAFLMAPTMLFYLGF